MTQKFFILGHSIQCSEIDVTKMLHAQGFVQHFSPQNLFNFHDFHALWGRSIILAYMT